MLIETHTLAGAKPSDGQRLGERVLSGEVVVVRGLLQEIGWLDRLVALCREELTALVGAPMAEAAIAARFERLHEQLEPAALIAFNRRVMARLPPLAPHVIKAVARTALGRRDVFAECLPNFRTVPPQDAGDRFGDLLAEDERARGAGKLTLHPPHYDSWHGHPLGMINLWCALGPVRHGNGMLIFPETWGERLPAGPDGALRRDQFIGRALSFALGPGDAILFRANHLHGSEVNRTDATRTVVSFRMTLGPPDFPRGPAFRYVYADWSGTPLQPLARTPVLASANYLSGRARAALGRVAAPVREARSEWRYPANADRSAAGPAPVSAEWDADRRVCRIREDAVEVGEVRPLDRGWAVTRTHAGFVIFARACPHQGADLAGGFVRPDGQIACPWHNLTFDPVTGRSPCKSLAPVRVVRGLVEDGRVRFELAPA